MGKISRFFKSITKGFQHLCLSNRGKKDFERDLLFSVVEANNQRIMESVDDFQISNKIDWRMDYFGDILMKDKASLIPLIVYFAEQNERALDINISSRGLPICQVT